MYHAQELLYWWIMVIGVVPVEDGLLVPATFAKCSLTGSSVQQSFNAKCMLQTEDGCVSRSFLATRDLVNMCLLVDKKVCRQELRDMQARPTFILACQNEVRCAAFPRTGGGLSTRQAWEGLESSAP